MEELASVAACDFFFFFAMWPDGEDANATGFAMWPRKPPHPQQLMELEQELEERGRQVM